MVVIAPEPIHQASMVLDKHTPAYSKYGPAVGHNSLVMANGPARKALRAEFSNSFAPSNIQSFLPAILEEGMKLAGQLGEVASSTGTIHDLEAYLANATADVAGHLVLGGSLNAQVSDDNLVTDLTKVGRMIKGSTTSIEKWNPLRKKAINDLAKKTSGEIRDIIVKRWEHVQAAMKEKKSLRDEPENGALPVMDSVLVQRWSIGMSLASDVLDVLTEKLVVSDLNVRSFQLRLCVADRLIA